MSVTRISSIPSMIHNLSSQILQLSVQAQFSTTRHIRECGVELSESLSKSFDSKG